MGNQCLNEQGRDRGHGHQRQIRHSLQVGVAGRFSTEEDQPVPSKKAGSTVTTCNFTANGASSNGTNVIQ
jgi:primosomal replication protein N